mmetsp:Transcript_16275/g.47584  ORF Transcript_16275/g.47584 Transcript_16275/m.47584 type:complete len:115 (+) Transcript_16275:337-681(+)
MRQRFTGGDSGAPLGVLDLLASLEVPLGTAAVAACATGAAAPASAAASAAAAAATSGGLAAATAGCCSCCTAWTRACNTVPCTPGGCKGQAGWGAHCGARCRTGAGCEDCEECC